MTSFSVWAPGHDQVSLHIDGDDVEMSCSGEWFHAEADGLDYGFSLDGGPVRPDPRSAWQPDGVHGLSRIYDHSAFTWSDAQWAGAPLSSAVLYELHVGTFTDEGTFDAAITRLDHLVDLGVTVVELLPCNAFDGRWGWGYDGVLWYAVHEPYGGPDGLKRFVNACHAKGLGVAMDVVYNHLGPAGNYLPEFGPYLTDEHHTPWGPAVNLDRPGSTEVRRFILDSALGWLRDFHIDGLRLDAVHALVDESELHLLQQLSIEVGALPRAAWLVAESDLNDPSMVSPDGMSMDAQWCDDVHHALHALLTGETGGYYGDFGSFAVLAKALEGAFVHDGTWSSFRGRPHGAPVPPEIGGRSFVVYLQDHDQIGNRATGDRIAPDRQLIGAALYLLSPYIPMLFMGEELGARTPWPFFSDHDGDLGEAVRQGRRAEFGRHGWDAHEIPDPQDESTFMSAKLDWSSPTLPFYRDLISLRRERLQDDRRDLVECTWDDDARWFVMRRGTVVVACNLSSERQVIPLSATPIGVLLTSSEGSSIDDEGVAADGNSVVALDVLTG